MFGFTGPACFCAWLYSKIFERLEPKTIENTSETVEEDEIKTENVEEVAE